MMRKRDCILAALIIHGAAQAAPVGTAFNYQGSLVQGGAPVTDTCHFEFSLWNESAGGTQQGPTLTFDGDGGNPPPIDVVGGVFTVALDFNAGSIDGTGRWLEIEVICSLDSNFPTLQPLAPRVELTPAPHALALPGLYTQENVTSPNVVGGYSGNIVANGTAGATIGGGGADTTTNRVTDDFGIVGGGGNNQAGDNAGTTSDRTYATVGGGFFNTANGGRSTIGGGLFNLASGEDSTVGGGGANTASGLESTVGGGDSNTAGSSRSTVSGGFNNQAAGESSTVGGGSSNTSGGASSTVGGGDSNEVNGDFATIDGGWSNTANGDRSSIGGGFNNSASDEYAIVGGGESNSASNHHATVGGGEGNTASGVYSTVGGGLDNTASFPIPGEVGFSTVGGGHLNTASGNDSAICGGFANIASGDQSFVGGGYENVAGGAGSVVPGGEKNHAEGCYSLAAGYDSHVLSSHCGTFMWSDWPGPFPQSQSDPSSDDRSAPAAVPLAFTSDAANRFLVRARGGARIYSDANATTGVSLAAGGGSWSSISDRNLKENLTPVDGRDVLDRLSHMPIATWNYTSQDSSIRHIGPMGQDFHAAFRLGDEPPRISTIDADGVALAAIQGLHEIVKEKDCEIVELRKQNSELSRRNSELEARLSALEVVVGELAGISHAARR